MLCVINLLLLVFLHSFFPLACSVDYCPKLGSLCQVRVQLQSNGDEAEESVSEQRLDELPGTDLKEFVDKPFLRNQDSLLQIPLGEWTVLKLGEGQCDIIESCLEGMKAGETCQVKITKVLVFPAYSFVFTKHLASNSDLSFYYYTTFISLIVCLIHIQSFE